MRHLIHATNIKQIYIYIYVHSQSKNVSRVMLLDTIYHRCIVDGNEVEVHIAISNVTCICSSVHNTVNGADHVQLILVALITIWMGNHACSYY